jgi:hypothetical protein
MSLVGHVVTRFAAHPENLATEALAYILRASRAARVAFVTHLSELGRGIGVGPCKIVDLLIAKLRKGLK